MQHIQRLYDEARFLKTYLEKLEAKAYFDLETLDKRPPRSSWLKRLGLVSSLLVLGAILYRELRPQEFQRHFGLIQPYMEQAVQLVIGNAQASPPRIVHQLVQE